MEKLRNFYVKVNNLPFIFLAKKTSLLIPYRFIYDQISLLISDFDMFETFLDLPASVKLRVWDLRHFAIMSGPQPMKSQQWSCSDLLQGADACATIGGAELNRLTKEELLKRLQD